MRGIGTGARSKASDRMMMVLPMYHATGGLVGCGAMLTYGGAVIIIPKFSASKFWDDAVKHGATMFTYVGELCRFLLSQPPTENERKHKISWIMGNGLRPEVWESFVSRFDIPHVIEFYGATEGNVSLINVDGPVGAVGRVPSYLAWKFNIDIIRYDVETGENPRGADGFCIREDFNTAGEMIGEIREDDPRFRFEGYGTKEATQKKILERELPHYARPVFLRLSKDSDTTSTFKFKKTNLVKAGFNPANISEPLFYADPSTDEFSPIDADVFQGILDGTVRL